MRSNAAEQIAYLRSNNLRQCYCVALAKPAGPNGMPAAETEATATYKWTTAGRDVTFNGVVYKHNASITSISYPTSQPELNNELSEVSIPDPTYTLRDELDRENYIGWLVFWRRVMMPETIPFFSLRAFRGVLTSPQTDGETRLLTLVATGPFAKYSRLAGGFMSGNDQKRRDINDTSLDRTGDKIEIKVG